jgi:RimJ/RimL family protein N-acetyltransferase
MSTSGSEAEVELRRVAEEDLTMMEELTQNPDSTGEFAWFGWTDVLRWRRWWDEDRMIGPEGGGLKVVRGDEALGFVIWNRHKATVAAHYMVIGIALLPEAQGHGYGTQAQRRLCQYLFAHTITQRIEAATEVDNIAEQRALEKAGFTREGITRAIGWRAGAWRDGVTYSMLRTDASAPV